mgnify:CR=1 FL=1
MPATPLACLDHTLEQTLVAQRFDVRTLKLPATTSQQVVKAILGMGESLGATVIVKNVVGGAGALGILAVVAVLTGMVKFDAQEALPKDRKARLGDSAARRIYPLRKQGNLLLVTLDTFRADRVGAYGHAGGLTPNLDRLAREGVRFDAAWSSAPPRATRLSP